MRLIDVLVGVLLGGFLSIQGHAQEQPNLRMRADQLFERMEYARAVDLYVRLADSKKPRVGDVERAASSYFFLNQYELAENWYARAVGMEGHAAESQRNYAEALKHNGKYTDAKKQLEAYVEKFGVDEIIRLSIEGCDSSIVWMANPLSYLLKNERNINTDLSEFGVFPTSNGVLYAGEPKVSAGKRSGMTGEAYLKVFSASRKTEELTLSSMMPDNFNSTTYHVGPVASNKAENVLYVTRTHPNTEVEKYKKNGTKFKRHNLELKIYRKNGDSWIEEDFAYNQVNTYSVGHAALSDDEQTLYFASDMVGGRGGVDIWFCELRPDGCWGIPINAGEEINSAGDEMFPTIFGNRLYYSSDGFAGMGGLDIYVAEGSKSSFSKRKNLRYPVNSAADDFSFVILGGHQDGYQGFISSNRIGGIGSDDIYSFSFKKPKVTIILEGITINKKTNELISEASLTLFDGDRRIVAKRLGESNAAFRFELDKNTEYKVLAEKSGFHADSVNIIGVRPTKDTTIRVTLRLEPIFKVGDKFVLEDIYYDFDKHNIRKDAAVILDQLVRTMRDNPTVKIELSSHTDSRGTHSYNDKLSQRRASSAVDYLVSRGIDRSRLVAKGYGERRLINRCSDGVKCSIEEHQANRRTEVEVLAY
ncbi:OmpA family protein [Sphingobacterium pedocola]|uniref:OmpA-like domain-containing protein n=1 Tax=Sphingobacterium pedocola TaxID=2082722 RepID=A0ABR9T5J4_9SPHI|nr:OmpA family protein [Sphingobacterium pedocola]MBE8720617.1 hypothetical protein [Sphingobacterium pedocola]